MAHTKETIWVGASGGVDSSVAMYLLKKAGYNVVACYLKTWQPDFIECTWQQDRRDAMRVAASLEIPFVTLDVEAVYKKEVADYMINEYKAGRTPNPDILCNKEVKFGVFLRYALAHGATKVATGHYARITQSNGSTVIQEAVDSTKDQSYFLWAIPPEALSQVMFPIGEYTKKQVRDIAHKYGLVTAIKKDSQGVCMLGEITIKDFLSHFVTCTPGPVIDVTGVVVGEHDGALLYTLGQRHGFRAQLKGSATERLYVIAKDITANTITVDEVPPLLSQGQTTQLVCASWFVSDIRDYASISARMRYQGKKYACEVVAKDMETLEVRWHESIDMPASGQVVVLYTGDLCLGGGVVA